VQEFLDRIRRIGFIVILGVCIIIYVGMGIVYAQQAPKQKDLEDQVRKTLLVVNKPLPSMAELRAEYDAMNAALEPMETPEVLEVIVDIARESGIDVAPESGKLQITPPGPPKATKLGDSTYNVLSLGKVWVKGDFDAVMRFVSDLGAGTTLDTMVLRKVDLNWTRVSFGGEEVIRRAEFRAVIQAVNDMMEDNNLYQIPQPINFEGGVAVNEMFTFPDVTTTAEEKGYTGAGAPLDGYILYEHDLITAENTTDYETMIYLDKAVTEYYYTCEVDGTVRQFDGPVLEEATEYFGSEEVVFETVATLAVELYSKPAKG